jgi:hypothetical protein
MGARVSFAGGKPVVTDGLFAEAKEAIGGYWINRGQVKGRSDRVGEALPGSEDEVLEIRPMLEMADFPEDVQKAVVAGHTNSRSKQRSRQAPERLAPSR